MNKEKKLKKATMSDVAKRAGVTIGTVSHVINGTASISIKTKKRVQKAIKELHYIPNSMARGLRRSESKMIGLIVPDITNEYYSRIARSFTDLAYKEGYTVMLCSFQYDLSREQLELDVLVDKSVDAIVVIGGSDKDEKLLAEVKEIGIPIILGDRKSINNQYPVVEFDNRSMLKVVIKVLKEKGYTQIGFVTEKMDLTNLKDRYDGYIEGMKHNGLEIREEYMFIEEKLQLNKMKNGYDLMKDILTSRKNNRLPEVFITTSDLVAIGMIGALKSEGYNVPRDFGIVGFDDISMSAYSEPTLTTILQDPDKIGHATWDIVYQALKKEINYLPHLILKQELIIRNSI
ncbi:LacI family DNA-binding transcriptional regulator [Vallitalea okinawensis]|uniref:LacI family DNA-binding transcriptional regulator n=1 Tax=Vallitalea okinawensis TaxID=2078660 RepID=UPI000CFCE58B|nr:LacI family DNA-binding transcriptional regulator [Vallitalea okinawensis]